MKVEIIFAEEMRTFLPQWSFCVDTAGEKKVYGGPMTRLTFLFNIVEVIADIILQEKMGFPALRNIDHFIQSERFLVA